MYWNEKLKELREDHDLSQTQMGKILGITQRTVSYYEKGERTVPPEIIIAYSNYFNVTTDYILGLTDEPRKLK